MNNIPWNEIIAKLEAAGHTLSEWAQTGAEHMYPLAVRKVLVVGVMDAVIGLLCVAVCIVLARTAYRARNNDELVEPELAATLLGAAALLVGMVACTALWWAGMYLLNPQWYAVKDMLALVKP